MSLQIKSTQCFVLQVLKQDALLISDSWRKEKGDDGQNGLFQGEGAGETITPSCCYLLQPGLIFAGLVSNADLLNYSEGCSPLQLFCLILAGLTMEKDRIQEGLVLPKTSICRIVLPRIFSSRILDKDT